MRTIANGILIVWSAIDVAFPGLEIDHAVPNILERQRAEFLTAETQTLAQRKAKLGELKKAILFRRTAIQESDAKRRRIIA